jgi:hypothetical protein
MSLVFRINGLHFYLSSPPINSVGQYSPSVQPQEQKQAEVVDTWNEIDRRNEHVLHPFNSKDCSKSPNHFSISPDQFNKNSNKTFTLNSYHSYRPRRRSSQHTDDQIYLNPTSYLNPYINKQSSLPPINNDPSFIFGNSIVKSNKAETLNIFDQQLTDGDTTTTYANKYGVIIDEDGPFWPDNHRILHPTPKLLTRELTPKEFYLSTSMSSKKGKKS